jgi:hypothetical protein
MPDQQQRMPWSREEKPLDGGNPKTPDIKKPDTSAIIKRMVDRDAAKKYRQRSGE